MPHTTVTLNINGSGDGGGGGGGSRSHPTLWLVRVQGCSEAGMEERASSYVLYEMIHYNSSY